MLIEIAYDQWHQHDRHNLLGMPWHHPSLMQFISTRENALNRERLEGRMSQRCFQPNFHEEMEIVPEKNNVNPKETARQKFSEDYHRNERTTNNTFQASKSACMQTLNSNTDLLTKCVEEKNRNKPQMKNFSLLLESLTVQQNYQILPRKDDKFPNISDINSKAEKQKVQADISPPAMSNEVQFLKDITLNHSLEESEDDITRRLRDTTVASTSWVKGKKHESLSRHLMRLFLFTIIMTGFSEGVKISSPLPRYAFIPVIPAGDWRGHSIEATPSNMASLTPTAGVKTGRALDENQGGQSVNFVGPTAGTTFNVKRTTQSLGINRIDSQADLHFRLQQGKFTAREND